MKEKASYNAVLSSRNLEAKVDNTNKMMQNLSRQSLPERTEDDKKERNSRTVIVRQYKDKEIRNSKDIRTTINKKFPGVIIRQARTTPGGSIVIELDDEETAKQIKSEWNVDLFGGNAGAVEAKENPPAGIVKHVFQDDKSEEEIIEEITIKYPNCHVDLFKPGGVFNGTIKIGFESKEILEKALLDRITIFRQRYILERYKYRPRVIKCNLCQKFGHIERLCRGNNPVCGKCCSKDHETKDCNESPDNYKCCHCQGNHESGSNKCDVVKQKLQAILNRNNGYE